MVLDVVRHIHGELRGEKIVRVNEVDRHWNKGQRKHRQRRGCRTDQLWLLTENVDHRNVEEIESAINQSRQHKIDRNAAAEIPFHFLHVLFSIALSPQRLQALGDTGENGIGKRIDETQHAKGGYPNVSHQP